ncbi:hypothetical protein [Spirosoma pollinicola]|nr:hypothetical protein [Spirosoma pollinicola]
MKKHLPADEQIVQLSFSFFYPLEGGILPSSAAAGCQPASPEPNHSLHVH